MVPTIIGLCPIGPELERMIEMKLAMQIAFKNMEHSEWIEALVREHAQKLDKFCDRIMSCRVVIEMPHKHQRRGKFYQVLVDITVPGDEIVVNREASEHGGTEDVAVAVRESFECAERLLEDYSNRKRAPRWTAVS